MTYLLDTDICVWLIRKKSARVLAKLAGLPLEEVGVSTITVAELWYGVGKSSQRAKNRLALQQFLVPLSVVEFDASAAELYGELRANLEANGKPIGPLDTLIAAQALTGNLVLITHNVREFSRIRELRVEDWTRP